MISSTSESSGADAVSGSLVGAVLGSGLRRRTVSVSAMLMIYVASSGM